jgi:hypothetical protein
VGFGKAIAFTLGPPLGCRHDSSQEYWAFLGSFDFAWHFVIGQVSSNMRIQSLSRTGMNLEPALTKR